MSEKSRLPDNMRILVSFRVALNQQVARCILPVVEKAQTSHSLRPPTKVGSSPFVKCCAGEEMCLEQKPVRAPRNRHAMSSESRL